MSQSSPPIQLPACWAHRYVRAWSSLKTLLPATKKIKDGCAGIESDLHITKDGVIVMFHDPTLDRVTNGTGKITESNWSGYLENLRTTKEPSQPLARLPELLSLLQQPGNEHVVLNLDIKPTADPNLLFQGVKRDIESVTKEPDVLCQRIILGLWHPTYIEPAERLIPACKRIHITRSMSLTKRYFWDHVDGVSVNFACLVGRDGQLFREEAQKAGKSIYTWTVNERSEMIEAIRMGVKAIMTDKPAALMGLYKECEADWNKVSSEVGWTFGWFTPRYYSVVNRTKEKGFEALLRAFAGPFDGKDAEKGSSPSPTQAI